ncbi:transglycosylase domain-containing protein [Paenibacillus sp. TAB 01]|uniref:transglycosylase domain-containing protein n=1 Tax=Paenibacillus sp. TAB 01 TaxID=3368988 RepID=UPI003752664B
MGSPRFIKNIRKRLAAWLLKGADTPAKTGGAARAYRPESRQTVVPPAQETKEKKSPARRTVRWRPILIGSGLLMLACLLIGGTAAAMWVRGLDVSKLERPLPEPTLIIDRSGQPASQLSSSKIVPVPLEQIPLNLRNAIIAVEDRRFYEHAGIDVWFDFPRAGSRPEIRLHG